MAAGVQWGWGRTTQPHHSHQRAGTSLLLHSSPSLPNTSPFTAHSHDTQHNSGKGLTAKARTGEGGENHTTDSNKQNKPKNPNIFHSL